MDLPTVSVSDGFADDRPQIPGPLGSNRKALETAEAMEWRFRVWARNPPRANLDGMILNIVSAIAPIFLLILLGNVLRRNGMLPIAFWNLNSKLVYWVLFPALLVRSISTLDFSGALFGSFAVVTLTGLFAAVAFSLVLIRLMGLEAAPATSVFQGAVRFNTFIALAVAETLFGAEGLSLGALVTAVLIPAANIVVVTGMVGMLSNERGVARAILRGLARNPLLLAVAAGLSMNLLDAGKVPVLHQTLGILGAAALPVMLLCIGANLRVREMRARLLPVAVTMLGKFAVFPLGVFAAIHAVGLTGLPALITMIFGCAPTAASGFTLARQMGGDAPLAAAAVTLQTALSFLTLPVEIALLAGYFGITF